MVSMYAQFDDDTHDLVYSVHKFKVWHIHKLMNDKVKVAGTED